MLCSLKPMFCDLMDCDHKNLDLFEGSKELMSLASYFYIFFTWERSWLFGGYLPGNRIDR